MAKPRKKPTAKPKKSAEPPAELSDRQRLGIAALVAAGGNRTKAAAHSGIALRTLQLWCDQPLFKEEFEKACNRAVGDAVRIMKANSVLAAKTLRRCFRDERGAVQVSAAKAVIEHAIRATQLAELFAKLEALEAQVLALTGGGGSVQPG